MVGFCTVAGRGERLTLWRSLGRRRRMTQMGQRKASAHLPSGVVLLNHLARQFNLKFERHLILTSVFEM
jgi:hypothetical protein